jgi:5-keto 4-deoxyuronate isomerase
LSHPHEETDSTFNRIDGAFAVAASFRYMPNLKKADMAFNPTTLLGAIAFANTLSYMKYLHHLNLTSCVLSMGEVLQLREAVDRARGIEASLEIDARFLL